MPFLRSLKEVPNGTWVATKRWPSQAGLLAVLILCANGVVMAADQKAGSNDCKNLPNFAALNRSRIRRQPGSPFPLAIRRDLTRLI